MFDAAHAALLRVNADLNPATIKTHRGLIAAFGERLVKAGRTTLDLGRSLNQVEQVRLLADYTREAIHLKKAQWSIDQAETFIAAMQLLGLRTWVATADFAVASNAGAGILETWHEMAGNRRRWMLIFSASYSSKVWLAVQAVETPQGFPTASAVPDPTGGIAACTRISKTLRVDGAIPVYPP